jgi:hypothetical protein
VSLFSASGKGDYGGDGCVMRDVSLSHNGQIWSLVVGRCFGEEEENSAFFVCKM